MSYNLAITFFMFNWVNFFLSFFWIFFFSIFFNLNNFFTLLFNAEILWIILYCLSATLSLVVDDIALFSLTFFILGFAAMEISLGLLLLILMKFNNLSLSFADNYEVQLKNVGKTFFKGLASKKRFRNG